LEGTVDWQYQKNLAESAVKKLKGVVGITNNIAGSPKGVVSKESSNGSLIKDTPQFQW
jgi:osmotically-inducible protein OsmY